VTIKSEILYPHSGQQWGGHHMVAGLFQFPEKKLDLIAQCVQTNW
jgi:hypothetical protein